MEKGVTGTAPRREIDLLDVPDVHIGDEGESVLVLATYKTRDADHKLRIAAGVMTHACMQDLQAEFSSHVLAQRRVTNVSGLLNDSVVDHKVVPRETWGGVKIPFYERRVQRAQRKIGKTLLSRIST